MLTLFFSLYREDCAPVAGEAAATRTASSKVICCARLRFFDHVDGVKSIFLLGKKKETKAKHDGHDNNFWPFLNFSSLFRINRACCCSSTAPELNDLLELFEREQRFLVISAGQTHLTSPVVSFYF